MKKIIITGANGQLGRAMNELYKNREDILCINTDVDELDITNLAQVKEFVAGEKPYAIVNCAAYTAVDACEDNEELAFRINAIGPRNLAIAAEENGAKIMHVSTDYVFDGNATKPYREYDVPGPQGVYGRTKLAGERFVESFSSRYYIVRTAWLYGDGKNFVKTMLRLAETMPEVRVVDDQVGSPTSALELAKAMDAILFTDNYGIFHGTCEGICSWADFAEEIFRLAQTGTKVVRITSEEFAAKAKRPAYSVLDNYMLKMTTDYCFADWKDALREYMRKL